MNTYTREFKAAPWLGTVRWREEKQGRLSWLNGKLSLRSQGESKASPVQGVFCRTKREEAVWLGGGGLGIWG